MQQKKFMDIQRIRYNEEGRRPNTDGFMVGDEIEITEKIDGANACIRYDIETDKLIAFSRKHELAFNETLRGFYNYVQALPAETVEGFKNHPTFHVFGKWNIAHTVKYRQECYSKFYVYDIYDADTERYLPHEYVRDFCKRYNLEYVHIMYIGKFQSWEHCISFAKGHSAYTIGDKPMEGVVIKNETRLGSEEGGRYDERTPFVLKYVNEEFSEIKKDNHIKKVLGPQHEMEKAHAQEIVNRIVTKNRVEKEINKMIDEGILPEQIMPQDMKIVAKNLPKRIYDDCFKEEKELVIEGGEYFGKLCSNQVMRFAREIIIG